MKIAKNQSGFSVVEILLVIILVSLLGFIGYFVYSQQQDNKTSNTSQNTEQATADDSTSAPEIKSTEDLTAAEKTLDETNVDNTDDSSQLDADLAAF